MPALCHSHSRAEMTRYPVARSRVHSTARSALGIASPSRSPIRPSRLPCAQLGTVAFESFLIQIEDAIIATSPATVVHAGPGGRHRERIVVGWQIRHRLGWI